LPEDVGLVVAVEIAGAFDRPDRRIGEADNAAAIDGRSVHLPSIDLAGDRVPPEQVGLVVPIEIVRRPCSGRLRNGNVDQTVLELQPLDAVKGILSFALVRIGSQRGDGDREFGPDDFIVRVVQ